jgi:hypothetical protein
MRFIQLSWITKQPGKTWVGSVSNKHNPSAKSGFCACISSRITTVIHVVSDHQINYNCFNEPFAVSPYRSLYWDMHGLIFETSIWLLAGSTRLVQHRAKGEEWQSHTPYPWTAEAESINFHQQTNPARGQITATLSLTSPSVRMKTPTQVGETEPLQRATQFPPRNEAPSF